MDKSILKAPRRFQAVRIDTRLLAASLLAIFAIANAPCAAADDAKAPFLGYAKYVRYRSDYRVKADGTDVETVEWALKVLTEQGVAAVNRASVAYSDRLQDAEILSAYTLKADGRRIDVPQSNFQTESNTGKGRTAPIFSDIRTRTVAFPEVAVGDTVVFSYKMIQKEPTFPGNFSMMESFSPFQVFDDAEITLRAPDSLPMHVFSRGVQAAGVKQNDGEREWSWTYHNQNLVRPEAGAVSTLDYGPLVVASTFKDYGAVAAAYDSRAYPKAAVTDRIRKLADQIAVTAHTPREQARALYDWVATNIEYAPNSVGSGSVVPHDAEQVLANRMGDCKDHTTLLESLLAAKNISSTPVLIDSGMAYELPQVATADIFNHLILYIPALNLFADSTSRYTPFGTLPLSDSDKPVVLTHDFVEVRRTPPTDPAASGYTINNTINIHPDGTADGEAKVDVNGLFSDAIRASANYLQPNMEEVRIRQSLAQAGYSGSGTMTQDDPKILKEPFTYSVKYRLDEMINLPGPGAMPINPPIGASGAIESFLGEVNQPDRMVNSQCYGGYSKENYTIRLPAGVEVMALPKDVVITGQSATYKAQYRQHGETVLVTRELDDHTRGNVCTPAYSKEYKTFAAAVRHNLRAQVLYR